MVSYISICATERSNRMLRRLSEKEKEVLSYVLRYAFINPSNVNLEDVEISTVRNLCEIVNSGCFRINESDQMYSTKKL
jgi:hypothetical protein